MPQFQFKPKGVCSMNITFSIDEGKVHDVSFQGGCNGNLKAVSKLVEGQEARHIIDVLKGNDCGGRAMPGGFFPFPQKLKYDARGKAPGKDL